VASERKVLFLDIKVDSMRDQGFANEQLGQLASLLNDGWDILQAIPLGAQQAA
jgi:hypothetical protein